MVRPPPRLRTKTGCLNCLRRRKKCDETHPSCSLCTRLDDSCTWRPAVTVQSGHRTSNASSVSDVTANSEYSSSDGDPTFHSEARTALGHQPSQPMLQESDKQYHPLNVVPSFLSMFVTPMAKSSYKDAAPWLRIIMKEEWARKAIMAFGSAWIALRNKELIVPCYKLYGSAVAGLRESIKKGELDQHSRTAFAASYFLGLFESLWSKHTNEQMYHWSAIARMLSLHGAQLTDDIPSKTIYGVVAETAMYNITNNAMFCQELDSTMRLWSKMKTFFESSYFDGEPLYSTSPLLAGRRDIYHLTINTFWLCRQDTAAASFHVYLIPCLERQASIFESITTFFDGKYSDATLSRYFSRQKIQMLTLRILLLKLTDPSRCSSHPEIVEATRLALDAVSLQANTRTKLMSDGLSWPLIILLCASNSDEQYQIVSDLAEEYIPIMAPGLQYRMRKVLEIIRKRRGKSQHLCLMPTTESCGVVHDGLSLLLQRGGLFADEDMTDNEE